MHWETAAWPLIQFEKRWETWGFASQLEKQLRESQSQKERKMTAVSSCSGSTNCGVGGIDKLAMKDSLYIYIYRIYMYIYIHVLCSYHYIYRKRDLIHNHVSLLVENIHKIIQDAWPGVMSHHPKGGVFKLGDQCYLLASGRHVW